MHVLATIIERYQERRRRAEAISELRRMSREQLRDIGIEPHRIEEVVDALARARREAAVDADRGGKPAPAGSACVRTVPGRLSTAG